MPEVTSFEDVLEQEGRLIYKNVGVSMMPLLRQNRDLMVIEKCDVNKLKDLDAVLFKRKNGAYVLHRIINRRSDGNYFIVGDNCVSGEVVAPSQILGKLTGVIRDGKQVNFNGFLYKLYLQLWIKPYKLRFNLIPIISLPRRAAGWLKRRILNLIKRGS